MLERLGAHAPDPPSRPWFDAALDAALAFQIAAGTVDSELIHVEDLQFYDTFVTPHIDAAPGPVAQLVETMAEDWAWVSATIERETMFGDLHFGNAAARDARDRPDVRLFDPIPRSQPWVFEPAYFEVISRGEGLVPAMTERRRRAGLATPADDDVGRAATLFLGWLSVMWWGIVPALRAGHDWCSRAATAVSAAVALDR